MRVSRVIVTVLLVGVAFSALSSQVPHLASAQSSPIPFSQEYASGDIQTPYGNGSLQLWYSWVNVNNTHTIFFALHSSQYPSPVFAYVGQAYNTSSGQRVFIGNAMLAMEVYNDTDHNGYFDANYTSSPVKTELAYTMIMNASQTFTPSNITKTTIDGVPHYKWGVTYGNVQAVLVKATPPGYGYSSGGSYAAQAYFDHVSMFYDFSVQGNTTFLKTSYQIGNVTLGSQISGNVTLQNLSLSLLHATLMVASKPLTVVAGGVPFDSQTNPQASGFTGAQVDVDNILAYEFRFKDNYTLMSNPPQSLPALYLASPIDSLPPNALQGYWFEPLLRVQDYVSGQLPDIAGLPSTSNINYSATQLLYRINYPAWSGLPIDHDPTYVAHISAASASSPPPSQPPPSQHPTQPPTNPPSKPTQASLPVNTVYVAVATGLLALIVAISSIRRTRGAVQPIDELADPAG
jgi:hypothetical protein